MLNSVRVSLGQECHSSEFGLNCTINKVLYNWPNETIGTHISLGLRAKEVQINKSESNSRF